MQESPKQPRVVFTVFVLSLVLSCSATNSAQGLADIARQERERKLQQPLRATHVYTNDDLKKPHILSPEDEARVAAAQKSGTDQNAQASAAPVSALPSSVPAPSGQNNTEAIQPVAVPAKMPVARIQQERSQPQSSLETKISYGPSVPSSSVPAPSDQKSAKTVQPLAVPAKMPVARIQQERSQPQSSLETKISYGPSVPASFIPASSNQKSTETIQPLAVPAKMPVARIQQDRSQPQSSLETKISYGPSVPASFVPASSNQKSTETIQPLAAPAKMPVARIQQERSQPQSSLETKISYGPSVPASFVPAPSNQKSTKTIQPLAAPAKMPVARIQQDRSQPQSSLETKISYGPSVPASFVPAPSNQKSTETIQPLAIPAKMPVARIQQDRPQSQNSLETKISYGPSVPASFVPAPSNQKGTETIQPLAVPAKMPVARIQQERSEPQSSLVTKISYGPSVPSESAAVIRESLLPIAVATISTATAHERNIETANQEEVFDPSASARVRVERGDSLWKLAESHLGAGARWRELALLNPELSNPDHIQVGAWIRLPFAEPAITRKIVVRPGDTLWSVAQAEFGNPLAFSCIAHANPNVQSADLIRPGQALVMPEACSVAR